MAWNFTTRGGVELYHGSALDDPEKWTRATALITDPPYRPIVVGGSTSSAIAGDKTVAVRDEALAAWRDANGVSKPVAVCHMPGRSVLY